MELHVVLQLRIETPPMNQEIKPAKEFAHREPLKRNMDD
jgi:hypothetical protein